jgi:hypothetical protein
VLAAGGTADLRRAAVGLADLARGVLAAEGVAAGQVHGRELRGRRLVRLEADGALGCAVGHGFPDFKKAQLRDFRFE